MFSRVSGVSVITMHSGDSDDVVVIPTLGAEALRAKVFTDLLPGPGISLGGPIRDRDARLPVAGRLDAQVSRLFRSEAFHFDGHVAVAVGEL